MNRSPYLENRGSKRSRLRRPTMCAVAIFSLSWALGCCSGLLAAATPSIVQCDSVPSKILNRPVGYCVDLPADYASTAPRRYPTLFFLHGLFDNDHRWEDRGAKAVFDQLTADGTIGKFIVVLPDAGETFYINSDDGKDRYEDFFIQEFVPFIDQHYRTIPNKEARGISGLSMGGYGALHLAMRHSDLFGAVAATSAVLITGFPNPIPTEGRWQFYSRILGHAFGSPLNQAYWEENSPLTLATHPEKFQSLKIYFDVGDQDRYGFEKGAAILDQILDKENYPHTYALRPGGHGWEFLDKYLKYSLSYQWQGFLKAEQTTSASAGAGTH